MGYAETGTAERSPNIFSDATGRSWEVRITGLTLKRVREDTGFSLSKDLGENPIVGLSDLLEDTEKFCNILFATVRTQFDGKVTIDDFLEHLHGDSLEEARSAFIYGYANFLSTRQKVALLEAFEKNRQVRELAIDQALQKLKSITPEQMLAAESKVNEADEQETNEPNEPNQ